ncbi:MAG: hypothetical protein R3D57_11000 [Hyphomicrobiaceae bacterium]
MTGLSNQVGIVTGGETGFGLAMAEAFSAEGMRVILGRSAI